MSYELCHQADLSCDEHCLGRVVNSKQGRELSLAGRIDWDVFTRQRTEREEMIGLVMHFIDAEAIQLYFDSSPGAHMHGYVTKTCSRR